MRKHGSLTNDEETNAAAMHAARGAVAGAARWGVYTAIAGLGAYAFSPLYRGFTFQFKVFIHMSGMIIGSMIEADKGLIAYEKQMRHEKRIARDTEVWRRFEEDFENRGTPGVGGEGNVKNSTLDSKNST